MNEDPLHLSLAITAYLLSLAVFIPLSGWVADRYGARRVFRAAILVFTLGSALCGISQSMPQLVGAHILQGIGGAMMVPVGRLVLLRAIPKSELIAAMTWLRSEEHTSELQSLMRISYAVFCLKKKTQHKRIPKQAQQTK